MIAATHDRKCHCTDEEYMARLGHHVGNTHLHAGMPLRGPGSLIGPGGLGSGCTHPNWVCPRLVAVRKRYGH